MKTETKPHLANFQWRNPARERPHRIVERMCVELNVSIEDILSGLRKPSIIEKRKKILVSIISIHNNISANSLGALFGRDHSTILHMTLQCGLRRHVSKGGEIGWHIIEPRPMGLHQNKMRVRRDECACPHCGKFPSEPIA